jgi:hypothetical protein
MNLNDPLKSSAQGLKNDYKDKISKFYSSESAQTGYVPKYKRYYPADSKGVIDEWKAIVDSQVEDAGTKKMEERKQKRDNQNTYFADLSFMHNVKNEQKLTYESIKAKEKEELDMTANVMDRQQKVLNREAKRFQKSMGENYIQEMANHKRQKLESKLRAINEEKQYIHKLEKVAEGEQFRNTLTKLRLRTDQDNILQLRQLQK